MTDDPGGLRRAIAGLSPARRAQLTMELARRRTGPAARPAVPPRRRAGRPAASFAQERMYFMHRLAPRSPVYLMPMALRLRGELRPDLLRRSLAAMLRRHDALRTGFAVEQDRGLVQVIGSAADATPALERDEIRAADVAARLARFAAAPFDLTRPPLLRAALWRVRDSAAPGEWVLALCAHHIVVDGWSLGVLADDLGAVYRALRTGAEPALADLPVQYADFAEWQREHAEGRMLAEQAEYWREELAGAPRLGLAGDRPRPAAPSFEGAAHPIELPAALVRALRAVGEGERATPFSVLLAGLAVVLGRWSGQSDLVIGTAVAGRPGAELERLVGSFVNTLPLRVRMDGDGAESFRDLLRRASRTCSEGLSHQDLSFERIVRAAGSARGAGAPLVQAVLSLRDVPLSLPELPGVEVSLLDVPRNSADVDLTVELAPAAGGGLSGAIVYATGLFDAPTIGRLAESLTSVYGAVAGDPGIALRDVPLMSPATRARLIGEPRGAAGPPVPHAFVHDLFSASAGAAPGAAAVLADRAGGAGRTLTRGELETRSNRLAWWLREQGIGAEDRIGVHLDRGPDLPVVLLAVFKAGAVYVPLDPGQPRERRDLIIGDAGLSLILSSSAADEPRVRTIVLGDLEADLSACPEERPRVPLSPENAAYVLHTSGSTGRPKGVVVSHAALSNRLQWMSRAMGFSPADVTLHRTTLGSDPSLWELCVPLITGGLLVLAEPHRHGDPSYLTEAMARHQVTAFGVVPSLLGPVLDEAGAAERMRSVRVIGCGGEELTPGLAARVRSLLPDAGLHNLYGPTEAAIDVCSHRVDDPVPNPVPIGRPIPGGELHVLDDRLEPVPAGVPGELFVGGVPLARGYLGRPGTTAERFVPHPHRAGRRLYRTGDRVRRRGDGRLEYLGRLDRQVKILGMRVEPAEVEACLREHPGVAAAVVLAVPGPRGDLVLAAWLTAAGGAQVPEPGALRHFLRRRLPAAMIPSRFVRLERLPLLPNGKADHAALLALGGREAAAPAPPAAPRDALQEVLLGIWSARLGGRADGGPAQAIGVHDDFFDLGGHSILATQIAADVQDRFRIELPLHRLLEAATVANLAELVRRRSGAAGNDADRIAEIILRVERMPAAEVRARLRAPDPGAAPPDEAAPRRGAE